jgi:hypothetical protein
MEFGRRSGIRPSASADWTSAILVRLKELSLPTVRADLIGKKIGWAESPLRWPRHRGCRVIAAQVLGIS